MATKTKETGVTDVMTLQQAKARLVGQTPLLFGKQIDQDENPKQPKETHDAYEKRTWRLRCHTTNEGNLYIPSLALKRMLENTAGYQNERIKGKGMQTWKKKFEAGVAVENDMVLLDADGNPISAEGVQGISRMVPSDGKRGGATRVKRTFPIVAPPWQGEISILLLDPGVQRDKVEEYLRFGGIVNGLGMWRPQKGGSYGRFTVEEITWSEISF